MSTADMIIKIATLLLSIALGFVLARTGLLKAMMVDVFKKIVVNVTLPAGLLSGLNRQMCIIYIFSITRAL